MQAVMAVDPAGEVALAVHAVHAPTPVNVVTVQYELAGQLHALAPAAEVL